MAVVSFDKDYHHDDEYFEPNNNTYKEDSVITPENILFSNTYIMKAKDLNVLKEYDYVLTYSWDIDNPMWYGAASTWYDLFEMWDLITFNTLPKDFGSLSYALLIPDCETKEQQLKFLKAIIDKYKISDATFKRLCQDLYFIYKPKEIILSFGTVPYEKYNPSNLLFIDGKIPKNTNIKVDNLYLSVIDNLPKESFDNVVYNFLFIYKDKRIFDLSKNKELYPHVREINIARRELPNTLIFDDIRRINFETFKKPKLIEKEDNKKRFLLYLTEKNKRHEIKEDSQRWSNFHLDDILNAIPKNLLSKISLEITKNQKELYDLLYDKSKIFSTEEILAIKEKGTINGNAYTIDDVINEESKIHFIIIGLTDSNRDFETSLTRRALERGINISTEVYLLKDLPIKDIHSLYDSYIFTPMYKWCTSRFIPEALYYKKKVIFTKEAKLTLKWNLPLTIRYQDAEKYLMFLAEDDIFGRPKSKLANHLLNRW